MEEPLLPYWLKIAYTVFVAILIPVYARKWGWANFLWFSDVALFVMLLAVWLESSLLASMMGVAVIIPEIIWNGSYFFRLITGKKSLSLTDYMFDNSRSLFLRALSLFHVVLPVLICRMLWQFGFDTRALAYQVILGWSILLICYFFTDPAENINLVFGPGAKPQTRISPALYFLLLMLAIPVFIYLPAYFLLRYLF